VLSVPGFVIREIRFSGEARLHEHQHERAYLALVLRGHVVDCDADGVFELDAGDVLFRPAGCTHRNTVGPAGSRGIVVEVDPAIIAIFCPLYGNRSRPMRLDAAHLDRLPERIAAELRRGDPARDIILHSLLMLLLAEGSRRVDDAGRPSPPRWLADVERYVSDHLHRAIAVGEVAAAAGMSPLTLSRRFRAFRGLSLRDYLQRCRMEAAAAALLNTDAAIGEIALQFGFYDQAHFARAFRAANGLSAIEYRRRFAAAKGGV
jgi:AraC family transcriptional regulator